MSLSNLSSEILHSIILSVYLQDQAAQYMANTERDEFANGRRGNENNSHQDQRSSELRPSWQLQIQSYNTQKILTGSLASGIHQWTDINPGFPVHKLVIKTDLTALSQTNRRLAALTIPLLFRLVEIKTRSKSSSEIGPIQRFLMTLVKNPALERHVQNLYLNAPFRDCPEILQGYHEADPWDIDHIQRGNDAFKDITQRIEPWDILESSEEMLDYFTILTLSRHYLKLFDFLPNLRSLKLGVFSERPGSCSDGDWEISEMLSFQALQNITELALFAEVPPRMAPLQFLSPRTLIKVFKLPNLKSLYLEGILMNRRIEAADAVEIGYSSIKEITLNRIATPQGPASLLTWILAVPRALKSLRFSRNAELERHLECQSKSLKSVIIRQLQGSDQSPRTFQASLPYLEELGIPIQLCGSRDQVPVQHIIPKSLKKFQLFVYDFEISEAFKVIESILDAKRYCVIELETLDVEFGSSFEIDVEDSYRGSRFAQSQFSQAAENRTRISELEMGAEAVGIKLNVLLKRW